MGVHQGCTQSWEVLPDGLALWVTQDNQSLTTDEHDLFVENETTPKEGRDLIKHVQEFLFKCKLKVPYTKNLLVEAMEHRSLGHHPVHKMVLWLFPVLNIDSAENSQIVCLR